MDNCARENIEMNILLETVYAYSGYDFRRYARGSLKRRLQKTLDEHHCEHFSELIPKLLYDESVLQCLLLNLSITVTEMFRDPVFFGAFRKKVVPILKTYPFFKIWHAGCATGEEVYSLAIILYEEGILDRAQIYGTDFNKEALRVASSGIYPTKNIHHYTRNYLKSDPKGALSDYYHSKYGNAKIADFLKKRLTFSHHNLATDHHFGEMHVVICRNVMIYFDKTLQNRALSLFEESLVHQGFLCLGLKESLINTDYPNVFNAFSNSERIYRLKSRLNTEVLNESF